MKRVILAASAALMFVVSSADARPRHHHKYRSHAVSSVQCRTDNNGRCENNASLTEAQPGYASVTFERSHRSRPSRGGYGEATILPHPAGCARNLFCGCGASMDIFGRLVPGLALASNWYKFPRSSPGINTVAVRPGHVFVLKSHVSGSMWVVHDYNSGGNQSRRYVKDVSGLTIVNPRAHAKLKPKVETKVATAPTQPSVIVPKSVIKTTEPMGAAAFASYNEYVDRTCSQDGPIKSLVVLRTNIDEARDYLARTASPGGTMMRQGLRESLACLHPTFAIRLASAIKEARASGLSFIGISSACRLPFLGVGGYANKFDSNHAYGLAADMKIEDGPRSTEAKRWHKIATAHKLYNPYYGTRAWWEYNHYQPMPTRKAIAALPALRKTITRDAIVDKDKMWKVAERIIDHNISATRVTKKRAHRHHRRHHLKRRYA